MNHEELNKRRQEVLGHMQDLNSKGLSCHGCQGYCCTFQNNSMQITGIEAEQILEDLMERKIDLKQVADLCHEAVQEYRLDKELITKGNSLLRRRYTCPFFKNSEYGCSLSSHKKPIGCLAFNATDMAQQGKQCKTTFVPEKATPMAEKLDIPRAVLKVLGRSSAV